MIAAPADLRPERLAAPDALDGLSRQAPDVTYVADLVEALPADDGEPALTFAIRREQGGLRARLIHSAGSFCVRAQDHGAEYTA